jgi:Raf kinase inhibitor-like YbhB/YbcL family protein
MKRIIVLSFVSLALGLFLILARIIYDNTDKGLMISNDDNKGPSIMKISSDAFSNGSYIPSKFTADGEKINPKLVIEGIPQNAKTLALIVDDPDAPSGTFVHWTVWSIDPAISVIGENSVPNGAIQGITSAGVSGYVPPAPPSGVHRYYFKIYALDAKLNLTGNAKISDLISAIEGHILDKAELMGLYAR